MNDRNRTAYFLSGCIAVLAAGASLTGLLWKGLYYRDSTSMAAQAVGQDLVTIVIGIPLLAISLVFARRGSIRGRLVWLGAVAYFLYTYATYLFGAYFNPLFLLYVAVFSCSLFAFIIGMTCLDPDHLRERFGPKTPRKTTAWFLIVFSVLLALMWLGQIVPPLLAGRLPAKLLVEAQTTTLVIQGMDLGIVVPLGIITGVLLLRDRPWGYALTAVLLVKFLTLALALLSMVIFMAKAGTPAGLMETLFVIIVLAGLIILTYAFMRGFEEK